ncbi:putative plastidic glucose transporter 3 [Hordeum vulgare]|uniref:Predicted protein n=1 Tax=Hordeum vulgare subsp. vulgare TaxID=112509 RepID=F2DBY8_HORVV|nr:uncharacterized protein LOC123448447 [Hordeum vulgare subsp. vulgare]XP_044981277.1 uncharacterized protein LOC123448447 [Hordeum vulgare subsp. vulgare]XP_044981278.1 uncharacterized protein LOC123448447 [Hordeum vulgare subsp. vulgare]XP_044981279.1 uncharacterized protein LOC123448447 [Hordeum vulgare subsp. vulgare]XP_044981280.1 uncharacterized protein LOC123448447 [Hordeum vulgare subsp. vulgare]KAE8800336.1 putative plastidic glucose transporter 3 [Hordeum vulgare]BAJ92609.1 predict
MAELVCACFLPWMDAELVVSICLGRAFVGCLFSGSVADGIGRRRAFQLSALPMIMGAALSCPWFDSSQERICAKGQLFLLTRITVTGCSTTTTSTTALTKLSAADTEEQARLLQTCMTGGEGATTASFTHQAADTEEQARLLQSLQRSFTFRAWLFVESGGHYFDPLTYSSS